MKDRRQAVVLTGFFITINLFFSLVIFAEAANLNDQAAGFSPVLTSTPLPTWKLGTGDSPTPTATLVDPLCSPVLNDWERHEIDPDRPSGQSAYAYAVDVNGDQWDDLLSGGHWYENPRGGIGNNWVRHDIGPGFQDIAAHYDFDGDGDLDLLGVEGDNWPLVWAENDGNGGFTIHDNIESGITLPPNHPIEGVAIDHFTNSGPLEIALTWDDTENPSVNPHGIQMITVPPNPLSGTWTRRKISDFSNGEDLFPADIDNDGDIDLYLGNYWLKNAFPSSNWTVVQTFTSSSGHADRNDVLDMDLDGDLDTIDAYSQDIEGKIAWYEQPDGNPFGTWTQHLIFQSNTYPGFDSMNIMDMDNDGDVDVVAGEHNWRGDLTLLRTFVFENLDGFGGSWKTHLVYQGDEIRSSTNLSDFDHDGDIDILSTGYMHNRVHIYENKSDHNCGTPVPTSTALPTWTPQADSLTIQLSSGWSMISSNVLPSNSDVDVVLTDISSNLVLMKNGAGQVYWPDLPVDQIGEWNVLDGYQIYMNQSSTLVLFGVPMDPGQTPIELESGFNLISYLPAAAIPIEDATVGISGSLKLVKNGDGEIYWPEYGINQIGDMRPGQGYLFYMVGPETLTYPVN